MNETTPTEYLTEKRDIIDELALDAHRAVIEGNYQKFRDNLALLDELRCETLPRYLRKLWRMYE